MGEELLDAPERYADSRNIAKMKLKKLFVSHYLRAFLDQLLEMLVKKRLSLDPPKTISHLIFKFFIPLFNDL